MNRVVRRLSIPEEHPVGKEVAQVARNLRDERFGERVGSETNLMHLTLGETKVHWKRGKGYQTYRRRDQKGIGPRRSARKVPEDIESGKRKRLKKQTFNLQPEPKKQVGKKNLQRREMAPNLVG